MPWIVANPTADSAQWKPNSERNQRLFILSAESADRHRKSDLIVQNSQALRAQTQVIK